MSVAKDYTIVDLETTGFSAQYNHIIEVGCIKFRKGEEITRYLKYSETKSPPRRREFFSEKSMAKGNKKKEKQLGASFAPVATKHTDA